MQPTKYPESSLGASPFVVGEAFSRLDHRERAPAERPQRSEDAPQGRAAPLDWIEEHLTYNVEESGYRRAEQGGRLLENWFVPADHQRPESGDLTYVLKVQPFAPGGYEATVRLLDLEKIGRAMEPSRRLGKREVPDEINKDNQVKAAARARRKMRYLVRNMLADHLITLTKAEGPNTRNWTSEDYDRWESGGRQDWEHEHGPFMSSDEWAGAWDRFRRLMVRVIGDFPYVAILEKHRKGNYHLHVAWCGRINVKVARKMWLAALQVGRGGGNIDAKHIKVSSRGDRASRIARYISKYVGKHFEDEPRYNKKRYWASRQSLEECRRYILKSSDISQVFEELRLFLGIDYGKFFSLDEKGRMCPQNFFPFPDGSGLWLNYIPELHSSDPPF